MTAQAKLITDYIDGNLSDKKSAEFLLQIQKNKSLKNEFVLIKDLNSYMKGKLFSNTVETDSYFSLAETEAKNDIESFLQNGKTDKEVLEYLSVAFSEHPETVKNRITQAEKEAEIHGINELTEEWVSEFNSGKKQDLKIDNKSFEKDNNKKHLSVFRKENLKYAAVAASFALMLLLNNIFDGKSKNEQIFAEYHQNAQKITGTQIRNPEFNSVIEFENGVKLFNSGHYTEAYDKFHQTTIENKNFVQALFYSGLALFESEKYSESVQIFTKVLTNFDVCHFESEWYLSLAYIKLNQMQKAVPRLKDIASQKNFRQNEANEILNKIKK